MTLQEYARESPFTIKDWRSAEELLKGCGFSEEDAAAVLRAAFTNALHPYDFARAAVQLRNHVKSGLSLNA